jgi:hypothetical protein
MRTYTYVKYFSDDSPGMSELQEAYSKLESDYLRRRDAMSPKARQAVDLRLALLRHSWAMLLEPVPKPWE